MNLMSVLTGHAGFVIVLIQNVLQNYNESNGSGCLNANCASRHIHPQNR